MYLIIAMTICFTVHAENIFFDYDIDSGQFIIQFRKVTSEVTTSKAIPIYVYKHDVVGRFLERYIDTIMEKSREDYSMYAVRNYWKSRLPKNKTISNIDEEYRFNYIFISPGIINSSVIDNCKGVILGIKDKIGILYDNDEEWINNLHLIRTNYNAKIELVSDPDIDERSGMLFFNSIDENPLASILKIKPNGKIDPQMIYYHSQPIQKYPKIALSFDWIEEFYKEHNLPSGCTYYQQLKRYEDFKRRENLIPSSLPIDYNPIH